MGSNHCHSSLFHEGKEVFQVVVALHFHHIFDLIYNIYIKRFMKKNSTYHSSVGGKPITLVADMLWH